MHCHHEKIVIVDETLAFVGGIDFTALEGDRHDNQAHPPRGPLGWHDAAVRLRGPAVVDVAEHFVRRWNEVADDSVDLPDPPPPAGDVEVQVLRTVPEKVYDFLPRGEFTILDAYLRALRSAERLIYLENQFLWSPEVVDVLAHRLRGPAVRRVPRAARAPGQAGQRARHDPRPAQHPGRSGRRGQAAARRRRSAPSRATRMPRSTSTPRSGSSTTAG